MTICGRLTPLAQRENLAKSERAIGLGLDFIASCTSRLLQIIMLYKIGMLRGICPEDGDPRPVDKGLSVELEHGLSFKARFEPEYLLLKSLPLNLFWQLCKVLKLAKQVPRLLFDVLEPLLLPRKEALLKLLDYSGICHLGLCLYNEVLDLGLELPRRELSALNGKKKAEDAPCLAHCCRNIVAALLFVAQFIIEVVIQHLLQQLEAYCGL